MLVDIPKERKAPWDFERQPCGFARAPQRVGVFKKLKVLHPTLQKGPRGAFTVFTVASAVLAAADTAALAAVIAVLGLLSMILTVRAAALVHK